jgi:myo-inositol 2-dehydrogenase/D-chiro-inositol 1-dehydrogenase
MSIRIAVIGTGVMGADHARIVARDLPGATLQVVCDRDRARAKAVADTVGAVDVSTDPDASIARGDVDAVILASPDVTHGPLSMGCIAAGKPVLCEIMRAEEAAGARLIQLGYMRRFDRSYIEMKQALDEGTLGRALMMHNFHRNVATPNAEFTGAMAITNSAPHEFDVARHVLGCEYASISAHQPRRSDDVVAPVVIVLETDDAQLVTIEINNNAAYGYDVRAELVGEQGCVATTPVTYTRLDRSLSGATRYDADWRDRYGDAYRQQNTAFLRFVATGDFAENAADCWDGYCSAIVAEAGVRALQTKARVPIAMMDRPGLYVR